jgi:formyltetrahydrofolate deformylase
MNTRAHLVIACEDRPGIVAAVTGFLHRLTANITSLDEHATASEGGRFFMRVEVDTGHMTVSEGDLREAFQREVAATFRMSWRWRASANQRKMAILASRADATPLELLWRWRRGELPAELVCVVSNHPDLREAVEDFGVTFHCIPNTPEKRREAEAQMLEVLEGVDLLVLARYMQILSPEFLSHRPNQVINIHHSFLPAFAGADPYRQAFETGVKRIGATAHYVTPALDAGPIIEQDVIAVSHRHSVEDLRKLGRDIERQVLARAVQWHLEDRILVDGDKTVVFV